MILSSGSLAIFWSNGIAATLSTLALLLGASPLVGRRRRARPVP
jgi:TctA family transporter